MRRIPYASIVALLLGLMPFGVRAQTVAQNLATLDSLYRSYNAIVLGDATFGNSQHAWGGVAVEGNLNANGWEFGQHPETYGGMTDPTIYVSGSYSGNQAKLDSGYASLPGTTGTTWNAQDKRLQVGSSTVLDVISAYNNLTYGSSYNASNPVTNPGPSNWSWSNISASAIAVQNSLASMTSTGQIVVSNNKLTFLAPAGVTAGDTVFFTLDASLLSGNSYNGQSFSDFSISVPTDVNFVVNVTNVSANQTLFGNGANINSNSITGAERLLWNILPAKNAQGNAIATSVTISVGGEFYGAVLAPQVSLSNGGQTAMRSQIIAANLTYSDRELHYVGFTPYTGSLLVPEPGTYALWGLGGCAGLTIFGSWRRRHRAKLAA